VHKVKLEEQGSMILIQLQYN